MKQFDLIVIGGGHAGLEAVYVAAQFDIKIALISMPNVPYAEAPCNPAIGGVGKGQVVREIDALGGVMGQLTDQSAIHYRTLNTSKGFAVQSSRAQIDKDLYSLNATKILKSLKNVSLIEDKVDKIEKSSPFEFVLTGSSGNSFRGKKLIVTGGTFLSGKLHIGELMEDGGRINQMASSGIKKLFSLPVKVLPKKFKTGTPPRLEGSTLDFKQMEEQPSDFGTRNFHCLGRDFKRVLPQRHCYMTYTNEETIRLIKENLNQSPMFNGQISGVGPRYCPSIEDKVNRYPERFVHHLFVEPEGNSRSTWYPNGISTGLPLDLQQKFVKTIKGLGQADIVVPGYAVEYDVVDTQQLSLALEYKDIEGLYFAGQINGTSGYEEAAAQGLMAGYNAVCSLLKRGPFILDRHDSYIGVLIEDLVSQRRDEPYRLFTARAENRLYMREDNTLLRMMPYRQKLNLKMPLDTHYEAFYSDYLRISDLVGKTYFINKNHTNEYFLHAEYGPLKNNRMNLGDLLKQSHLNPVEVLQSECHRLGLFVSHEAVGAYAIEKIYETFINRNSELLVKMKKLDQLSLNWREVGLSVNISNECKQRINEIRPLTFGQLRKIDGIRPATLAVVANFFS